jgi:hypothetical protein
MKNDQEVLNHIKTITRFLVSNITNSTDNSTKTNSTAEDLKCEFFDAGGYVTQALLGLMSFSVLLSKLSLLK